MTCETCDRSLSVAFRAQLSWHYSLPPCVCPARYARQPYLLPLAPRLARQRQTVGPRDAIAPSLEARTKVAARPSRLKSKAGPAERHPGVLWKPQRFVQVRIVKNVPEMIDDLAISPKLIRKHKLDRSQHNARNVSLLCSNTVFTAGERTRSRNRATAAASGRLCVGGRFCHSKFCAALIALSITRSDFMEKKCVKLSCAASCE